MHNKNETMKKIEKIIQEEVEPQKAVDDKILGKKRELTHEQKERKYASERRSHKKLYKYLHVTLNRNHHQDVIAFTEASDKTPTQIYIELVRKELNK